MASLEGKEIGVTLGIEDFFKPSKEVTQLKEEVSLLVDQVGQALARNPSQNEVGEITKLTKKAFQRVICLFY